MAAVDTRNLTRESLFVMAELAVEGRGDPRQVKVRNLSDGGLMAEGDFAVEQGDRVVVTLRNVGPVCGAVAWSQGNRIGIAFDETINARAARPRPASEDKGDSTGIGHEASRPRNSGSGWNYRKV